MLSCSILYYVALLFMAVCSLTLFFWCYLIRVLDCRAFVLFHTSWYCLYRVCYTVVSCVMLSYTLIFYGIVLRYLQGQDRGTKWWQRVTTAGWTIRSARRKIEFTGIGARTDIESNTISGCIPNTYSYTTNLAEWCLPLSRSIKLPYSELRWGVGFRETP